ncbi:probable LRR receptor-like serine/threonine-protein kinase At1g56140 isoform X3 [Quercus robur]|uniref:probable LRR receptor-like serine/threonine-protein kinase At1g56140 isoform X3 n=1 Tax=Quercus robur TaxID=38942 RepID=UPI00216224E9|nr:probable LRR receptor-like serine/threonine-protein kinase At1g56140 isoform X3 [Quercus robur]
MVGLPQILVLIFCAACIFGLVLEAQGAAQPAAAESRTDPVEVTALSKIFEYWRIVPGLSSTEPCNEAAYKPYITCNCSYDNNSTCHITSLDLLYHPIYAVIPEALWNLTFLTSLNLFGTYLSGKVSSSIGNLKHLQFLHLGITNFSGSLPSELGNLRNLERLWIDSCGVGGEIPSTFANLVNLQQMWASDNEFTGRIPDFIGNWSRLTVLGLQGNSFEGPLPSTLSNLTSMERLVISDVSSGTSSLAFINDMESLVVLGLRNNNISDSIPLNIGGYKHLERLDLSFNNIRGQIPDSLFQMSSLTHLSLGNNKLNGTLPESISGSVVYIDLSYNYLRGGSFPSWVNSNLRINLVANQFTIKNSSRSAFYSGLNCLQRSFPCNRGSGIYSEFAIDCGGPQITSSTGVVYEADDAAFDAATYYVTESKKWAVSTVGYFEVRRLDKNPYRYKSLSDSEITNTLDSQLYQTTRLSPSSLRYYGLGLKNGNYSVTLHFAEIAALNPTTINGSLGRRVFDIYIQEDLVLKDFDIKKEAGGITFRAVQKEFKVQVSENYLEIHLFWAGKGTCCVPDSGDSGPSISAITATLDFIHNKQNRTDLIVGIVVGAGLLLIFLFVLGVFCYTRRRKHLQTNDDDELLGLDARPFTFKYVELKRATNDFSPANKLGEGGFGAVYKGKFTDGRVIAVKKLSVASLHGERQFVAEIATLSAIQHRNLVKLHGCCIEGDKRLLVYEYLENGSLDQALFRQKSLNHNLSTRYNICLGIARGLAYLHEESRLRIIHRDVKASNILLDTDLVPKISDFGLAKLYDDKMTHVSTRVAGTLGYLAPEYAMRGHLTEKVDVFGFGVVALEIISGRPNFDSTLEEEKMYLLEWAWHLYENKREIDLVDPTFSDFNEEEVKRMIRVPLLCTQASHILRPSMSRVVAMLLGDIEVSTITSKPAYLTDRNFDDVIANVTASICYDSSESTSMVGYPDNLPVNASKPMLGKIINNPR